MFGVAQGMVGTSAPTVLGQRLVIAIVLINLMLSLIATAVQLYVGYRRDADEVFRLIDVIDGSFRKGFEDALWEYNFELVEALLDGVHHKADVVHVALETPSGRQWSRGEHQPAEQVVRQLSFRYADGRDEPPVVGTLTVGLTLDNVEARAWAQFWVLLAANFAKSIVASVAMLLLFGHVVTRHLRRIAEHVSKRDGFQHDEQLVLQRTAPRVEDEIDLIVQAVNRSHARALNDYRRIAAEVERRGAAEQVSEERADQLAQANLLLADVGRQQAEFTYALAHDLKAPIATIAMLLRECRSDDVQLCPEADELLSLSERTNDRMSALVEDVLGYARTIGTPLQAENIDLAALLAGVLDDLRSSIAESGAIIVVDDMPPISGSPAGMRILLQNLLSNAIKFRDPERAPRIAVRDVTTAAAGFVQLVISDNGIGIETKYHESIFGMFKRLHTHDAYAGSGVGLALCKRVIERQGGTIAIDSEPGTGTCVTLTLRAAM